MRKKKKVKNTDRKTTTKTENNVYKSRFGTNACESIIKCD